MRTRSGYDIKFYEIYESRYINGAYYDNAVDVWYPRQWGWDGHDYMFERELDLVHGKSSDDS